jgi:hypothetical protein
MGNAAAGNRVLESLRDVCLPDDFGESLRAESPGQHRVMWATCVHRWLLRVVLCGIRLSSERPAGTESGKEIGRDAMRSAGNGKLSPSAPESQRLGLLRLRPDPVGRGPTASGDSFSFPTCDKTRRTAGLRRTHPNGCPSRVATAGFCRVGHAAIRRRVCCIMGSRARPSSEHVGFVPRLMFHAGLNSRRGAVTISDERPQRNSSAV